MTWALVERVLVRKVGNSFIGEARTHATFATGEILPNPVAAMESAAAALDAILRPKLVKQNDEFEDML